MILSGRHLLVVGQQNAIWQLPNCYRDGRFHSTYFAFLLIFLVSFVFLYFSAFLPLA
jgi:hypothetical protein